MIRGSGERSVRWWMTLVWALAAALIVQVIASSYAQASSGYRYDDSTEVGSATFKRA